MAQPQTNGLMDLLDPFGIWKQTRDSTLDSWSKIMIDLVQSDAYARSSGMLLDQMLGPAQPVQDMVQKRLILPDDASSVFSARLKDVIARVEGVGDKSTAN